MLYAAVGLVALMLVVAAAGYSSRWLGQRTNSLRARVTASEDRDPEARFARELNDAAQIFREMLAQCGVGAEDDISAWDDLGLYEHNNNRSAYDEERIKQVLEPIAAEHGYACDNYRHVNGSLLFTLEFVTQVV